MGDEEILRKLLVVTTRTETKLDAHLEQGARDHKELVGRVVALEKLPKTFLRRHAVPLTVGGTITSGVVSALTFLVSHR